MWVHHSILLLIKRASANIDNIAVNEIINNSNYLAYKFNFNTECVEYLPATPHQLRHASWLRQGFLKSGSEPVAVPIAELIELLSAPNQSLLENPPRFIFHTAFCGSTFLSRCLDIEGVSLSLREPQLLLDAANAKRLAWKSQTTQLDHTHLPKLALVLLLKHAAPGESLLIKPINSVNNIVPELLQLTAPARSLMLYTDARSFLLSTLKKGEQARQTTRAMFDLLRCDFPHLANLRLSDAIHMSDLKIILTLWRLQVEQAENLLKQFSADGRMASLYADRLIDNPQGVLQAANQFLELGISDSQISSIVRSDLIKKDAKQPEDSFSIDERDEQYRQIEKFYGADLENGYKWMIANNPGVSLSPALSSGLPDPQRPSNS